MDLLDDTIAELRDVLAVVEDIDLWPPQDAVQTLVNAVASALAIATRPPDPAPDDLGNAATAWRQIASSVDSGCQELSTCREKIDAHIWSGVSANAFRMSMRRLGTRTATIAPAALGVAKTLDTLTSDMAFARERHRRADDQLRDHLPLSWDDLVPWEVRDHLRRVQAGVSHAIREAIGAYSDAADAVRVAEVAVRAAMDDIDLPHGLAAALTTGASPVALVNSWDEVPGPLLMLASLDPSEHSPYVQPDSTTCGSSTLVMARMLNDPAYAVWMETGFDPRTGHTDVRTPGERFDDESRAMHDRTSSATDRNGGPQVPWPHALGTAPWSLAHEMSSSGGSGVPETHYDVQTVSPRDRGATYDLIVGSVEDGHPVPLYVGDDSRPGHVVLVTGSGSESLTIFDPASGRSQTISRHDFTDGDLGVSGWDEPWFAVTPSH